MTAQVHRHLVISGLIIFLTLTAVACRPGRQGWVPVGTSTSAATPGGGDSTPGDFVEEITSGG